MSWMRNLLPRSLRARLILSFGALIFLSLFLAGTTVIVFKLAIPAGLALSMEFLVGIALFALGLQILWEHRPKERHVHIHEHLGKPHAHEHAHLHMRAQDEIHHHNPTEHRSFILGMIHGLAGSGALILVVLGSTRSLAEGIAYILIFGLGSILGMAIVTTLIGLPFALSSRRLESLNRTIRLMAGALSVALGFFIMFSVAIVQGLFHGIQ